MPSNTATMDSLLKDVYEEGVREELNDAVPELEMFEKAEDLNFEGRQVIIAARLNRNRGSGFAPEGGIYPTAGQQQVENFRVPVRYQYGQYSATEQILRASRSNKGSFARELKDGMSRMVIDMKVQKNFAIWGWGMGPRCLVNGSASSTTQTLDAPGGVAGATNGTRFVNVGDFIGFVNPVTGALRLTTVHEVTSVPAAGTTIVIAPTASTTDNDWVVNTRRQSGTLVIGDTDYAKAPMGILGMVDDGTYANLYFGLSRTTYPILQSTVLTSVGALSGDALQRGLDVVLERSAGQPKYGLMHPHTLRAYLTITENDRRYTGGDLMNPDVGTNAAKKSWDTGITFGGINLKRCPDAPYSTIVMFDPSSARRVSMDEGSWLDRDGAVLTRSTTAVDTWDATYRIWDNFILENPNQSVRYDGITTTVVVAHRI